MTATAAIVLTSRPEPPPPSAAASPASNTAAGESAGVSGCLAGPTVTVDALLEAQSSTPATPTGAAAFAGVFQQFVAYAPTPSGRELRRAFEATTSGALLEQELEALGKHADQPGGAYGDGKDHRLSLEDGHYFIESASDTQVVVTLAGDMLVENTPQLSADGKPVVSMATLTLEWADSGWSVVRGQVSSRTYAELLQSGTPYAGGC